MSEEKKALILQVKKMSAVITAMRKLKEAEHKTEETREEIEAD